jgi:outer membrane protein
MRNGDGYRAPAGLAISLMVVMVVWSPRASAETIESAMALAYRSNPQLNAQRAQLRAADENVPQALSGYRPKVDVTATGGQQYTDQTTKTPLGPGVPPLYSKQYANVSPYSVGATLTQPVFDGFITPNKVGAAESNVSAQREALRVLEQTVLLTAATSYMDVLRDSAALEVQHVNVQTLQEVLGQTRERFDAGEVTSTDVSQAEAQLAAARTAESAAVAQFNTSRATYRQVTSAEALNLTPASPVDRFSPSALGPAIERGQLENPNVTAAMYGVDVAYLQIKVAEGALFPQLAVQANAQFANSPAIGITNQRSAAAVATLTVPVYQGGAEYSVIRQSKDTLEQQRLNVDFVRDQVRQSVVQFWGQVQATKTQVRESEIQVRTAQSALGGIRQEARVGQRTTFDILTAQQNLVNARLALVVAQHDRVVASYNLLGSTGRLSPRVLGLPTPVYDPTVHYRNTRDAWFGVRPAEGDKNFQVGSGDASDAPPVRQAKATVDARADTIAAAAEVRGEDAKAEDAKAEDHKGEVRKVDTRKPHAPLSLTGAASGARLDPDPEASRPAAAPRAVAVRSQPKPSGRAPDQELTPEEVLLPRDIRAEPRPAAPPAPAPQTGGSTAPQPRGSVGLLQGSVPVVPADRFTGGNRPAAKNAPKAAPSASAAPRAAEAAPAPRAVTPPPAGPPMSGALPLLPSGRFDAHAPPAQPRIDNGNSNSNSFAEPAAPTGSLDGPFAKIR